jgi:hypothetical protein
MEVVVEGGVGVVEGNQAEKKIGPPRQPEEAGDLLLEKFAERGFGVLAHGSTL